MEITVKESSLVRPAADTPSHNLWCSPLDLQMARWKHVSVSFFYKPNGSPDFFQYQKLKEALSNVLVPFYPAAGRLGRDENGRMKIVCNAEGVLFVEAEATATLDLTVYGSSARLAPSVDYTGNLSSYPLVLIQVTRFKCGGVALGVKLHHILADASSMLHFVTSWCATARGKFNNAILPFTDRTIIKSLMPSAPTFHHIEFDQPPAMNMPVSSTTTNSSSSSSVLKITEDQLNELRAKSNRGNRKYNTFCILSAHIWRCVTKARGLPSDQATKLRIPIDGRSKLALPPGYFGNTIFSASIIAQAGDLLSEQFEKTVKRIHKALNQQDEAYLKSAIACLDNLAIDPASTLYQEQPYRLPNLSINKMSRFPVQEVDFGWGASIFMGRPPTGLGMIYIVPPSSTDLDDGGLTLISGLERPHTKLFQELICQKPLFVMARI